MEGSAFIAEPPAVTTISRAVAKGDRFEISGDEPHNALIRPLSKAAHSYVAYWKKSFDRRQPERIGRLALPVAVVDAPLILTRGGPGATELMPADWVRVISHRAISGERDPWKAKGFDVVEVVHASFFERFLDEYALPHLRTYYERLGQNHEIVASGKATVDGWRSGSLPDTLIDRISPRRSD